MNRHHAERRHSADAGSVRIPAVIRWVLSA